MSIALHYSFRKIDYHNLCDGNEISEESVEQVYLKACDLVRFPEWLIKLKNLTHINISCNNVAKIPIEIKLLDNLNYFDLSDNRIMVIPAELLNLVQLKYLDLSGNFIATIPGGILLNYIRISSSFHICFFSFRL
jgi:Leucine-rich repeat (LRR) protein